MNRSTPGLPVHHQLPEFTQTHVHWVRDAIQPSHPLSSPSPASSPSQHQSLFQWVNSSHEVAKVLKFQLQYHSFLRNPRADLLQNGLVGSTYYINWNQNLSRSCYLTITSSIIPFSCPQYFPASGSFQMSHLFTSAGQNIGVSASTSGSLRMSQLFAPGGQSIGVSASTSVLPMNTQGWWKIS